MLLCLKQLKETVPQHDILGSLSLGVPHGTISIMQVLKAGRSMLVPAETEVHYGPADSSSR